MRAQKPKVQFSIRVPAEIIKLLDEIAENTGLNITRNNVVEQACEWYVLTYRANGNRALTNEDFNSLVAFIQGKDAGAETLKTSASFGTGSSTAQQPDYLQTGSGKSTI